MANLNTYINLGANVASIIGSVSGGTLSTSGNVIAGNVLGGTLSTIGNITIGDSHPGVVYISNDGFISATGNVTPGNIITSGLVSVAGNITGGNIFTAGLISATANITGNNILGNGSALTSLTGNNVTGTVPAANVTVNAVMSLVSNNQEYRPVLATNTAGNLPFKGSAGISWNPGTYAFTAGRINLGSGIGANGVTGTYAYGGNVSWAVQSQNGTGTDAQGQEIGRFGSEYTLAGGTTWDSYVAYYQGSGASSGWLIINAAGNAVANVTGTGVKVTGTVSASGNVTGGNVLTAGLISATANVTGGNVLTAGLISATANVTGGNVLTAGLISATANVTGGNVLTAGLISATGNLTAGNISATGNISGTTAGFTIGYLNIPQVAFSANATIALTDAGKHYYSTTASNLALTIANNTSVSWPIGATITVIERAAGNIIITPGTGVSLYYAGNSTAGSRVLSTYGMATLINVEANVWMVNGSGLT